MRDYNKYVHNQLQGLPPERVQSAAQEPLERGGAPPQEAYLQIEGGILSPIAPPLPSQI